MDINPLIDWKNKLFNTNYEYQIAVKNGFKGTEEEWLEHVLTFPTDKTAWGAKNYTLGWVTEEDIDAMFEGTYEGEEINGLSYAVSEETLIINKKGVGN